MPRGERPQRRVRRRRTQEERREETRGAVLDATVECLASLGYARTTTTRIARRAGVSRGALLHHYPSKEQLLASAVEHVFQRRVEEFRAAFTALPEHADRANAAIDILWQMFSGPTFHAWLELVVAARGNRKLAAEVSRIGKLFGETVQTTYRDLFGVEAQPSGSFADVAAPFTFAFLQGVALDQISAQGDADVGRLLDTLKAIAEMTLGTTRPQQRKRS